MASNQKSTTDYIFDPVTAVSEARHKAHFYKTLFVEGVSDEMFWEIFKNKNSGIKFKYLKGKANLLEGLDAYTKDMQDPKGRISFCMDRDFDQYLEPAGHAEPYAYYQMCDRNFKGGYNDLECFLFNTECFDNVLTNYCGVTNEKKIAAIRKNVIEIAAIIGSYRLANRYFQKQFGSKEPYLYCFRTDYDFENKRQTRLSEICVDFFLEKNLITYSKKSKLLSVDASKVDLAIPVYIKKEEFADIVPEIIKKAAEIRSQFNGNEIDYCRGHDLTELLFFLVSQKEYKSEITSSIELESKLRGLPHDAAQKDSYIRKLQKLEVNQFVKI